MKYSVVVATYNRVNLLKQCLEAVSRQTVSKNEYEVIVINDGSKDHTDQVIAEFHVAHPEINLIYVRQKNWGVACARNEGIKRARGEIIFFTDDDCVVPKNWIETLADGYRRHPEIAGAGGWYEYPEEVRQNRFIQYLWYIFCMAYGKGRAPEEIKNTSYLENPAGNTSNMSYRKSVLDKIGGFDESINFVGFVDWELKKRVSGLGHPLLYIPYYVLHLKSLGIKTDIRKFFNRGRGKYHLVKKNPDLYRVFFPHLGRAFYMFRTVPPALKWMALTDFLFTRLGWEYQKIEEIFSN